MRAAYLPFPGDPFLLNYWLTFYDRFWAREVDKLYIHLNSPIEKPVVHYIQELCEARSKIVFMYTDHQKEHGYVLDDILSVAPENLVMWVEDDGFIFKQGQVDRCFNYLESGEFDIVGSKRGSCSQEILSRAERKWGIPTEGEGDQGCNFWPNFFFTTKDRLLRTDRNFCAKTWQQYERIPPLDMPGDPYTVLGPIATADTFVWGSLQLQDITPQPRIKYLDQYHGSPDDQNHYERNYNLFDGLCPWIHVGSLSSGVGGILQDGKGRSLARRLIEPEKADGMLPNYCHTEQEQHEWERRVQWWLTFYNNRDVDKIDEFSELYFNAIQRLINQYDLSQSRIAHRQRIYATLGL